MKCCVQQIYATDRPYIVIFRVLPTLFVIPDGMKISHSQLGSYSEPVLPSSHQHALASSDLSTFSVSEVPNYFYVYVSSKTF
jgi:hypothetical protein